MNHSLAGRSEEEFKDNLGKWTSRAKITAMIVNQFKHKLVRDFGCGHGTIRDFLMEKDYIGYDSVDILNDDWTEIVDLNEKFPKMIYYYNHIATCTGILEYIEDVDKFFKNLSEVFSVVVFTYTNAKDTPYVVKKVKLHTFREITKIVREHYRIVLHSPIDEWFFFTAIN